MDLSQIPIPGDAHYLASQTNNLSEKPKGKMDEKKEKPNGKQERKAEQFLGAGSEKY